MSEIEVISKRFCFEDADITLQSIDGVLFKVHKKILMGCGPVGFVVKDVESDIDSSGRIHLPENSSIFESLFQYIYSDFGRPSLDGLAFEVVEALGDAAAKYQVYRARDGCWVFMRNSIPENRERVVEYAKRNDCPALRNLALEWPGLW